MPLPAITESLELTQKLRKIRAHHRPEDRIYQERKSFGSHVVAETCAEADAFAQPLWPWIWRIQTLLVAHPELEAYIIFLNESGKQKSI